MRRGGVGKEQFFLPTSIVASAGLDRDLGLTHVFVLLFDEV